MSNDYASGFLSDWFALHLRRRRASFAAAIFLGGALVAVLIGTSQYFFGAQSSIFVTVFYLMWWGALGCLACQRLLDMGFSRWWGLLFLLIQFLYVLVPLGALISLLSIGVLVFWPSKEMGLNEHHD